MRNEESSMILSELTPEKIAEMKPTTMRFRSLPPPTLCRMNALTPNYRTVHGQTFSVTEQAMRWLGLILSAERSM